MSPILDVDAVGSCLVVALSVASPASTGEDQIFDRFFVAAFSPADLRFLRAEMPPVEAEKRLGRLEKWVWREASAAEEVPRVTSRGLLVPRHQDKRLGGTGSPPAAGWL